MKQFKNLKKFRQEYDLTQEELGKILNITKQSVWTLEKKDEIPLKYKQILEKKYNCEFIDEQQKQLIQQNSILDMTSCETSDIEADYYPEVFGSCGNGVFTLSETKERIKIPEKCFIKC